MATDGFSCDSMASEAYYQVVKARKQNSKSKRAMQYAVQAFGLFWAERTLTWPTVPSDLQRCPLFSSKRTTAEGMTLQAPEDADAEAPPGKRAKDSGDVAAESTEASGGGVTQPYDAGNTAAERSAAPGTAAPANAPSAAPLCQSCASSDIMAVARGPVDTFMHTYRDGLTSFESAARTPRAQTLKVPAEVEIPTGFCSGMELPVTGFDGLTYAHCLHGVACQDFRLV